MAGSAVAARYPRWLRGAPLTSRFVERSLLRCSAFARQQVRVDEAARVVARTAERSARACDSASLVRAATARFGVAPCRVRGLRARPEAARRIVMRSWP